MKQTRNPHYIIWTLFQNLTPNSAVFSPQLMKAGTTHVLRRILHFRWLGQTVLRIHLSHGVYANFKVNFSHCASSQFSYVFSFLFLFTVWYVVLTSFIIVLSMSIQPYGCKDNKILSYLNRMTCALILFFMTLYVCYSHSRKSSSISGLLVRRL